MLTVELRWYLTPLVMLGPPNDGIGWTTSLVYSTLRSPICNETWAGRASPLLLHQTLFLHFFLCSINSLNTTQLHAVYTELITAKLVARPLYTAPSPS